LGIGREGSANNNLRSGVAYKLREKLQPQSELGLYSVIIEHQAAKPLT